MKRLALLFALVLLTSGCFGRGNFGAAIFATGLIVGSALSEHHHEHERVTQIVYVGPPVAPVPLSGPPSTRDAVPVDDAAPPFDARGARGALARIDVSSCRAAGAPRGYGHAKVTFNPSGDISKVVIDEPQGLPASAVKCVGDKLGAATIAEFRGSLVTVGTTWYVP